MKQKLVLQYHNLMILDECIFYLWDLFINNIERVSAFKIKYYNI